MVGGGMGGFWTCFALLAVASAGPLHRHPRESEDYQNEESVYANYTANEVCFSEGEVFQKGDMMPNPGPCEECRCEPPSIVCNMVKCPTNNNGCRTIQRPNHCCPDYNCECDYNGQLYNDGERLELPEEPCQVCYCKGGEVMCNSITCYHRDDCDPITVPGQCCPKYENCPVRDMGSSSSDDKNVLTRSTNKTNHVPPKREMNPWLLTKVPSAASSSPPATSGSVTSQGPATEGGVVIVSDWLTERRTTTEDAARLYHSSEFTDGPHQLTSPGHLTTDSRQDFDEINTDRFTPVDEVIFTRIDGQREKVGNVEGTISTTVKETHNVTSTSDLGNSNDLNTSEAPLHVEDFKLEFKQPKDSSDSPEKYTLSKAPTTETAVEIASEAPIEIQEIVTNDKNIFLTVTPAYSDNALEHNDITASNINLTMKRPIMDDQKEIIFQNILGLEGLSLGGIEEDTTTKDLFESYTTDSEESVTDINELTEFAVVDQTKDGSRVGEVNIHLNDEISTSDDLSDATTYSDSNNEATTPLFIEINVEKDNHNKNDHPSVIPKIIETSTLDSNAKEELISTSIPQEKSSPKNNILPMDTESIKTNNEMEPKTKRNKLNETEAQDNSRNKNVSTIKPSDSGTETPISIQEEIIVSEMNSKSQNVEVAPSKNTEKEFSFPTLLSSDDTSDDGLESTSDTPVLELNSHVPFLQLGGHENTEPVVSTLAQNYQTTSNQNLSEVTDNDSKTNLTSNTSDDHDLLSKQIRPTNDVVSHKVAVVDESSPLSIKKHDQESDNIDTETTTDIIYSTSHIPLSPGDLKVLAEYLINDTIKTVPGKNESDYVANPWLKGNLTSEEKMTSILSAANVSIAVMNKTDDKVKKYISEATTKPSDVTKVEKIEKDKILSGNNALNDLKIGNKTRFIQGKSDEYSDTPKINSEPETHLNDEPREAPTTSTTSTVVSSTKTLFKNTAPPLNENTLAKLKANNEKPVDKNLNGIQSSSAAPMSTQRSTKESSDNVLQFDNVNPASNQESYENIKNNLVRIEKSTDSATSTTVSRLRTQVTP